MAEQDRAHNNTAADQLAEPLEQIQQQLTAGSARVAQLRAQWQATLREAKLARAATSDTSWDLADVEQRLRELADQREGPDDLLMEREIARLAGQRVQLEERVLAQLLLVDELNARVQIEEQALASAEADWALREKVLITERDQLEEGHRTS
jgi:hypothetical protein